MFWNTIWIQDFLLSAISKTRWELFSVAQQLKMLIKACFVTQPLEQEGGCQKCCIALCNKVLINHFDQMKASPEWLNTRIYWSKYCVDRLRRTLRRKVYTGIFYQQIYRLCHHFSHQVAHTDCTAPSGKQHDPLTGVWGIPHLPGCLCRWTFFNNIDHVTIEPLYVKFVLSTKIFYREVPGFATDEACSVWCPLWLFVLLKICMTEGYTCSQSASCWWLLIQVYSYDDWVE